MMHRSGFETQVSFLVEDPKQTPRQAPQGAARGATRRHRMPLPVGARAAAQRRFVRVDVRVGPRAARHRAAPGGAA